jgi:hypothetical protein
VAESPATDHDSNQAARQHDESGKNDPTWNGPGEWSKQPGACRHRQCRRCDCQPLDLTQPAVHHQGANRHDETCERSAEPERDAGQAETRCPRCQRNDHHDARRDDDRRRAAPADCADHEQDRTPETASGHTACEERGDSPRLHCEER